MPEPADPLSGDLRERLRDAIRESQRGLLGTDRPVATGNAVLAAVLPVVEAETAALRQRAEQAEAKVRWLLDKLPVLERAALGTAATDSRAAVTELVECISAALDRPEGT